METKQSPKPKGSFTSVFALSVSVIFLLFSIGIPGVSNKDQTLLEIPVPENLTHTKECEVLWSQFYVNSHYGMYETKDRATKELTKLVEEGCINIK